ncbi:hypothetical protein Tco_0370729 [Tanacetum coccineum]
MGDEHLDTIPATESDEVIKSSAENLVPIPSESERIPENVCDVTFCNNLTPLEAFKEHSKTIIDSNMIILRCGNTTTHADFSQYDSSIFDLLINPFPPADMSDFYHKDSVNELAHIISPLEYPVAPPYLLSCGNEDTSFDPGISIYHSFMPGVSHRSGTFIKFNDFPDSEVSKFCPLINRASNPQLQLGIRYPNLID